MCDLTATRMVQSHSSVASLGIAAALGNLLAFFHFNFRLPSQTASRCAVEKSLFYLSLHLSSISIKSIDKIDLNPYVLCGRYICSQHASSSTVRGFSDRLSHDGCVVQYSIIPLYTGCGKLPLYTLYVTYLSLSGTVAATSSGYT